MRIDCDVVVAPVLVASDKPAIHLNKDLMTLLRPQMEKFYYDPSKHQSYLDQLGIKYPPEPAAK